jgi:hypothetical protein
LETRSEKIEHEWWIHIHREGDYVTSPPRIGAGDDDSGERHQKTERGRTRAGGGRENGPMRVENGARGRPGRDARQRLSRWPVQLLF